MKVGDMICVADFCDLCPRLSLRGSFGESRKVCVMEFGLKLIEIEVIIKSFGPSDSAVCFRAVLDLGIFLQNCFVDFSMDLLTTAPKCRLCIGETCVLCCRQTGMLVSQLVFSF